MTNKTKRRLKRSFAGVCVTLLLGGLIAIPVISLVVTILLK